MVVRIKIIWAKTCPICKRLLKEVLIPLQMLLPDKLVIEFKETIPMNNWEGTTPLLSGGYYKTAHGRTPEVYIGEKVYVIPYASYTTIYKFLNELLNILEPELNKTDITIYRKVYLLRKIEKIRARIKKLAKKELEIYKWYYSR